MTALQENSVSRDLENAIVRLLKVRPFYGQILICCRRRQGCGDYPLGVTLEGGVPTLALNETLFALQPPESQEALLEHAVKHLLHLHMARRKGRNLHDWDLACDLAVNPSIANLPVDAPLPRQLEMEEGLAAEEYYRLLSRPLEMGNLEGHGLGDASRDAGRHSRDEGESASRNALRTVDDHSLWQSADSTPLSLAEEVVRSVVRQAWQRCDGEMPADISKLAQSYLAPSPIPWRQVLRQFVATAGRTGRSSSWLREHRRFEHQTPGIRTRRLLNILVGVDVSDSTDIVELREAFARELMQIARGQDLRLTVLYATSRIQRLESFRGSMVKAEVYRGGGFTDLRPVFDHARTMHPRPAAVIYLTDGIGPAPEVMEFPTLWVLTADGEKPAPWGVELRLAV
jgi:predicted metal-dependent peptidase